MIPWTTTHQVSLSSTISQSLLKFMSIELVMVSNYLILCHPLLLLPSIFPSIGVFSSELAFFIQYFASKYWSFSFSVSPSNSYLQLISFRIDWFNLFAVQETLKSLLLHCNSKVVSFSVFSLLYGPAFTSVHDYWKNHSFDYMGKLYSFDCISKVMSLFFNTLSRFVIAFLSRSKHLLISWLQPTGAHKISVSGSGTSGFQ